MLKNVKYIDEDISIMINNIISSVNSVEISNMVYNTSSTVRKILENKYISPSSHISPTAIIGENVYIGNNVKIMDFACVENSVIMENSFIGQYSLVRDYSFIGSGTSIGFSSEIVRSAILNDTMISHRNGISCSLIGNNVNFSVGAVAASYRIDSKLTNSSTIYIQDSSGKKHLSSTSKFGVIVGDDCRIGAYVILNPGVILESSCIVYPGICLPSRYYFRNSKIYIEGYYQMLKVVRNE